jgi:hypothetical protein
VSNLEGSGIKSGALDDTNVHTTIPSKILGLYLLSFSFFMTSGVVRPEDSIICPKLKSYLEKVHNIADDKEEYDFSSTNNSSSMMPLDNYGKLEFFIKYHKTSILPDKWEKGKKWGKLCKQSLYQIVL